MSDDVQTPNALVEAPVLRTAVRDAIFGALLWTATGAVTIGLGAGVWVISGSGGFGAAVALMTFIVATSALFPWMIRAQYRRARQAPSIQLDQEEIRLPGSAPLPRDGMRASIAHVSGTVHSAALAAPQRRHAIQLVLECEDRVVVLEASGRIDATSWGIPHQPDRDRDAEYYVVWVEDLLRIALNLGACRREGKLPPRPDFRFFLRMWGAIFGIFAVGLLVVAAVGLVLIQF